MSMTTSGPALFAGTAAGQLLIFDTRFNILSNSLLYSNKAPLISMEPCTYANTPHLAIASCAKHFEVAFWNL